MPILDTRSYPYRRGERISDRESANDPANLARKYRRVRPYDIATESARDRAASGTRRAEGRPKKTMGYYD